MVENAISARSKRGEIVAAFCCLILVVPFLAFVLLEGSVQLVEYLKLASAFLGIALTMAATALFLFGLIELAREGRRSGWKSPPRAVLWNAFVRRWSDDRFLPFLWPLGMFLLLLPTFNAFKQRILPQAGFELDPTLADIDRALFGTDPGIWLHGLIGSPGITRFLDAVYHSWFVPTTLGICIAMLCTGTRSRSQYMLSYVTVWILLGAVCAYLLPAAGPAFYEAFVGPQGAAPFRAVHEQLLLSGDARYLSSLGNQAYLRESLNAPELVIGGGISAIPSVHNALAVLFAIAAWRVHALAGFLMSIFALLVWVASIYLNWHYGIDGVIGGAGAVAIWFAAGWVTDWKVMAAFDSSSSEAELEPVAA